MDLTFVSPKFGPFFWEPSVLSFHLLLRILPSFLSLSLSLSHTHTRSHSHTCTHTCTHTHTHWQLRAQTPTHAHELSLPLSSPTFFSFLSHTHSGSRSHSLSHPPSLTLSQSLLPSHSLSLSLSLSYSHFLPRSNIPHPIQHPPNQIIPGLLTRVQVVTIDLRPLLNFPSLFEIIFIFSSSLSRFSQQIKRPSLVSPAPPPKKKQPKQNCFLVNWCQINLVSFLVLLSFS